MRGRATVRDLFGSTATPLTARPAETGAFLPPSTSPDLVYPTTLEECENEGGIGATTRAMSRDEAAKLCLEIVRLHELHIVGMTQRDLEG